MTRVAYVVVGDLAGAADAADAAWLAAWTGVRRKRTPEALGAWLCSLAAAEAVSLAGRRDATGATALGPEDRPPHPWAAPTADVTADDALARALARLDAEDRALLALRHVASLSVAEVGQAVRRAVPPVGVRLERLAEDVGRPVLTGSDPADQDRLLGQRLRDFASIPLRQVSADATARRARAEESLERTRVVSVAIAAVAGAIVALHPQLAGLFLER